MRIAMVSEHASPLAVLGDADAGGQNVYVAALSQELARRGHEVVVHTRRASANGARRVPFEHGVVVDHVTAGPAAPIPKDAIFAHLGAFARDLRRQWQRWRPDVVHAHFWMSGVASLDAADPLDLPVVQTFHALGEVKRRHQGAADPSPPQRLDAERRLVAAANRIVATCTDEAFELRQLGADLDRVTVVPCGVNLANFRPDGPAFERPAAGRHRIVAVSRLVRRKGIDTVIRALRDLPTAELVVAGGPPDDQFDADPEVARLRGLAGELGVAERVRFVGALERHEVPPLLRSADVVVTTPWYEPFGIVPLEAMACGTPVVAAAVGGMIDTVVDGVTGRLVPPRDPAAVAAAVRDLLADPERRAAYGRAGVDRVRARYAWSRVADGVEGAYQQTRWRRGAAARDARLSG